MNKCYSNHLKLLYSMWHLEGRGCSKLCMPMMPLWDQRWRKTSEEHVQQVIPAGWGGELPGMAGAGGLDACV